MEKTYSCEHCGGQLKFDAGAQKLKCSSCGTEIVIIDEKNVIEHSLTSKELNHIKPEIKTSKTMKCNGCGAQIEVGATAVTAACPYCGSDYVMAKKQLEVIEPDGVVPFQIDRKQAREKLRKWIKGLWLSPKDLKSLTQFDKFQSIYLPYWTFDAKIVCEYTAMGGKKYRETYQDSKGRTKHRTVTQWFFTGGNLSHSFDDMLIEASSLLNEKLLEKIKPFDTQKLLSYSPDYLAGYASELYTVDLQSAYREATKSMENELNDMVKKDVLKRFKHVKDLHIRTDYQQETYKHVLLPVFATTYQFKGKKYNVLINGQTGEIQGQYPKSIIKVAILLLAGILAVLLFYAFLQNSESTSELGSSQNIEIIKTLFGI